MIRDFLKKLDPKYLKICAYAAVTVLLTVIIGSIAFSTGPFWSKLWSIFTAVLKPIIIGGIIWYLIDPVVKKFENLFNKKNGAQMGEGGQRPADFCHHNRSRFTRSDHDRSVDLQECRNAGYEFHSESVRKF